MDTKEWLTVSEVAEIEGVSTETIRRGIKAFKYPASRASEAARAPWLINAAAYERQREIDAHKRRVQGFVTGYGEGEEFDAEFAARVEKEHGRPAADALRKVQERNRLFEQIADEVRGDPDLRRAFEALDDDEILERTAQEIANRVRREERIRRRAAQILAAEDDHHDA